MVANLFNYLVLSGVNLEHITIHTFYNGQRKKIVKCLKVNPSLKFGDLFNVFTVGSYQGGEKGVILLSLVRSNGSAMWASSRTRTVRSTLCLEHCAASIFLETCLHC